jgi:transcriptional regulator with XRE-family HTH domain
LRDLIPKANKGPAADPKAASLGLVIRELRNSLGLTQVQFASEVGITPTTVYRYEAGTNTPTNDILASILKFAVGKQALNSVQSLAEELASRSALYLFDGIAQTARGDDPISTAISRLRLEQQSEVMAAVLMLLESSDTTAIRIFKYLVEPWMSRARNEFGPVTPKSESLGNPMAGGPPKK